MDFVVGVHIILFLVTALIYSTILKLLQLNIDSGLPNWNTDPKLEYQLARKCREYRY